MQPKVFISYSWTSDSHRDLVRAWADRLIGDGVEVILDQYDLKEGQDKYSFMEKMVTDPSITHVLVINDKQYAEKADARKAGVGTESQIISQELYAKVDQTKFIPIRCEFSNTGEPYLPIFMKSRIGIDFSTAELVNENWEQLVRLLFGKPLFQKPEIGKPPAYLQDDNKLPSNPAVSRFATWKLAFMQGRKGVSVYREDFLRLCFEFVDALRVRSQPDLGSLGARVLDDCGKLVPIRNLLVDWVLVEAPGGGSKDFEDALLQILERLLELRSRPKEITSYNESWFEAHELFVYETFLYIIAALRKEGTFGIIHNVLTATYLRPEHESHGADDSLVSFGCFHAVSQTLNSELSTQGQRLLSPAAALLKRQADRTDLPFTALIEAELIVFLMAVVSDNIRWYPQTLFYAGWGRVTPLFLRAAQRRHFEKISIITGIQTGDELRAKVKAGMERMNVGKWTDFSFHSTISLWTAMNMDKLDTLE